MEVPSVLVVSPGKEIDTKTGRLSDNQIINKALNNKILERQGYISLSSVYC